MYGHQQDAAWRLGAFNVEPPFTRFDVFYKGSPWAEFKTRMIGQHNLRNLLAGIAAGVHIGIRQTDIAKALATFKGVRRRQEVRGVKDGITVIDDFAHHPTAVLETINAVKSFYEKNRVFAVFEPRTNSSRRNVFQSVYADAFDRADMVCIRQAPMLEKIPSDQRFSSQQLVEDLRQRGQQAFYFPDTDAIIEFLLARVCPGDVLLIMSNGGFDNIHARLLEAL